LLKNKHSIESKKLIQLLIMRTRISKIRIYPIMVLGLTLFLTISCKKDRETPNTVSDKDKVSDKDGNIYKTVNIGTQVWLAENLKTTKYNNGDLISTTIPADKNISGESICTYQWPCVGGVDTWCRLYTWHVVTDSRGVCPISWHIPNQSEWTTLINYLGGDSIAGYKLKETGKEHWLNNTYATNESGFSAIAGGTRYKDGFHGSLYYGRWWSSTEYTSSQDSSLCIEIHYWNPIVPTIPFDTDCGLSVRCIKN
jgi:uncharacterized protein (TIGR02145 family)